MKICCKIISTVILLFAVSAVHAQSSPIRIGLKGGLTLSSIEGDVHDKDLRVGGIVGVTVDYALSSQWFFLGGLELTTKGGEVDIDRGANNVKIKATYLQTPFHIGYKFGIGQGIEIMPHIGSYLAVGVGGKTKMSGYKRSTFTNTMDRFDFGLGTGGTIEFSNNIVLDLNFDYSLFDIGRHGTDLRNFGVYMTAGYKF